MGVDTSLQMYVGEPNSVDYPGGLACGLNLQVISLMATEYIMSSLCSCARRW